MSNLQVIQLTLGLCLLLLAYAYVVFPVIASLLATRKSNAVDGELALKGSRPNVSLIIPAYNEEDVIEDKIRNSLSLDWPAELLEIFVACDGGDDATAEIASEFRSGRVNIICYPVRRGKASVINDTVERAEGDLLLLCDANVMFSPDVLIKMAAHFKDESVGAVSGDVRLRSEDVSFGLAESLYYQLERRIHSGESRLGAMMGVDGGMYMVRRELVKKLASDTILDDFTISMGVLNAGRKVIYEPAAVATENATESARSEFKRRIRIGSGTAQVMLRGVVPSFGQFTQWWLFMSHKVLRWISPWLLFSVFGLLIYLSAVDARYWLPLGICLSFLALAMVGVVAPGLRRLWVVSVPFYFFISQLAMAFGFARGILFHQDAMWERTSRPRKNTMVDSHAR